VSSTLNRSKEFSSKHMFVDEEACWNSDQGSPQYVLLNFERPVVVTRIQLTFQGGFASSLCRVLVLSVSYILPISQLTDFSQPRAHHLLISKHITKDLTHLSRLSSAFRPSTSSRAAFSHSFAPSSSSGCDSRQAPQPTRWMR
jgi:hypothetical protein